MTKKKKPEDLLKEGRKTKYKEEYCQDILKYFNVEPKFETPVDIYDKKGNIKVSKIMFVPVDMPTFAGYCGKIGIHREILWEWSKKYPKFGNATRRCKEYQEKILVSNALSSSYNPTFSIFFAKNCLDWKDKTETDIKSGGEKIVSFTFIPPTDDRSKDNSTT